MLKHGDLMARDEDLGVLSAIGAGEQEITRRIARIAAADTFDFAVGPSAPRHPRGGRCPGAAVSGRLAVGDTVRWLMFMYQVPTYPQAPARHG